MVCSLFIANGIRVVIRKDSSKEGGMNDNKWKRVMQGDKDKGNGG